MKLDFARVDWHAVLQKLGVQPELISNPRRLGPCPIEGQGKTRFRLENKEGRGNWHCNHCGHGDGVRLVALLQGCTDADAIRMIKTMEKGLVQLPPRKMTVSSEEKSARDIQKARARLQRTWDKCELISKNNAAGIYLVRRVPFLKLEWLNTSLRFSNQLYHFDEETEIASWRPALIGRVLTNEGVPVTLHRTYLSDDGYKANVSPDQVKKLMTGVSKLKGDAIPLNSSTGSRTLAVTEGIETGLAIVTRSGNAVDVWAAINAQNLSLLRVPRDRYDKVVIFTDRDPVNPRTGWRPGEHYAEILFQRLASEGFACAIKVPKREGQDFADLWLDHCRQKSRAA